MFNEKYSPLKKGENKKDKDMKSTQERFEQLKELELNAKSNKEFNKIQLEFDRLSIEDPNGFEDAFIASARGTLQAVKKLRVKEQIQELSEIVSMSYIAKTYFNKTKSWMSQRINELNVNGKPAQFSKEEIKILNEAIRDISTKIGSYQIV